MTFTVPELFLNLSCALIVSLVWGMSVLIVLSCIIAGTQGKPSWKIVGEHVMLALVVIAMTHWGLGG